MSTVYEESELSGMSRSELDQVAEEIGLDPADYGNKTDEIAAILAEQEGDDDTTDDDEDTEGSDEPVEAEPSSGFAGVDISTIDPESHGKKPGPPILGPDEHILLTAESWVELGADPSVPDWAVGRAASVAYAPVSWEKDTNGDNLYPYTDPNATITVRERSQGARFDIPLQSVERLSIAGGRSEIINHP